MIVVDSVSSKKVTMPLLSVESRRLRKGIPVVTSDRLLNNGCSLMKANVLNGNSFYRIEIQIGDFETNMESLGKCLSTSLVNFY